MYLIFDARGNGGGEISPTITGDHQNRITDYTAIVVSMTEAEDMELSMKIGLHGEIAETLDASYWKGCGMRGGQEREVVFLIDDEDIHREEILRMARGRSISDTEK